MRALPTAVMLLFFAAPAFPAATTPHDPFRALALLVPKPPEEPICCLKPLTPLEPDDDDLFLSFEQWKERQLAETAAREQTGAGGQSGGSGVGTGESAPADAGAAQNASTPPSGDAAGAGTDIADSAPPPHFRVPVTDRFNYASLDCSARVHTAHRAAQSAANILSSKRDRYMLSPCAAPTYVVVELCEDIRIDTVQLANFEFFSGVFKEFRVSVRKTYATDLEGWTEVGTYVAKNVRGVQYFHPPTSLRDFYRFIRIDFLSHYGNEYYCPISLLRVYGLTHLEEWKWDVWKEESRAKLEYVAPVVSEEPPQTETASDEHTGERPGFSAEATDTTDLTSNHTGVSEPTQIPPSIDAGRSTDVVKYEPPTSSPSSQTQASLPSSLLSNSPVSPSTAIQSPDISDHARTPNSISSNAPTTDTITSISSPSPSHSNTSNPASSESNTVHNTTSILKPIISLTAPSPALHPVSSGESIYRTIMNRLSALEANHTLYARYVSDQTSGLRAVLRRLGEDVGRLEGLGRAQAQNYQRAAREFERQRRRMEEERRELLMKVDYLAEEIVLEKRLGIAQLCLLLAVLVFLGLTRGSRPETFDARGVPGGAAMRAWGRRNLSLSGDWVNRLRGRSRSRSLTPSPPSHSAQARLATPNDARPFPSATDARPFSSATDTRPFPSAKPHINVGVSTTPTRRRTPTLRSPLAHHTAPPASRLQRSNSHGSGPAGPVLGPVPRSAKRWARSAHLHEVRRVRGEAGDVCVSAGVGPAEADKWASDGRSGSPLRVVTNRVEVGLRAGVGRDEEDGEGEVWVDTDVDADVDASEGGWS